jgi:cytochrome c oxidase cbb3-type subunit 2
VPWSVMPSYSYYFNGNPTQPKQEARDLVAYIDSLGRARELAWPDGDAKARNLYPDDQWVQMSLGAAINAHPAKARLSDEHPDLGSLTAGSNGEQLWQTLCAGCHGTDGTGNGPAAGWLAQRPANLALNSFTTDKLAQILWNGVAGTSMPAWRDISQQDLATIAAQVQSYRQAEESVPTSAQQLALGETVWNANCVQCHGTAGDGKGFAAAELQVQPTDFTGQQPALGESVRVLTTGVAGTQMGPWTDRLSDAEILAVSHYLRRFFGGRQ